jgi:6-bladed beta-propeller
LLTLRFAHVSTSASILLMLLSACTGSGDRRGESGSLEGGWTGGRAWRVVEEARIGSRDGDGPDALANVVAVAIDAMGRVWIADAQRHQLQVFDARGTHVRSIGAKGAGPGEFGNISGMAWAPDGRLWVLDGGNSRFAVYDSSGALVTTRPRNSIITTSPWPGRFDFAGRLYDMAAQVQPDASFRPLVVRCDSAGQPRDTFPLPSFHAEVFSITHGDERNQRVTEVNVPFTGRQAWAVDPGGDVWVANTARYRIEQHAFSGGVQRVIERRVPVVPVTREDRDRILESYRHFTEKGGRIDVSRIPDRHPAISGFLFDDAGNLWVSPTTSRREGRALDVFDPAGRYRGRVTLPVPERTSLKAVRGNRMALISRDSLDVQTVIVVRIEEPGR